MALSYTNSPITQYFNILNKYPANNMVWFIAKDADGEFDPDLMTGVDWGSSPAAKGRKILEVFNPVRIEGDVEIDIRPSTNTFFAGRFWCAGLPSSILSGRIYYSQILERLDKVGKCYSDNDPTSEQFNEPLDTDGGVIKIPEIGAVQKLVSIGNGIAIIADNGVWFVRGGDNGFTPTSHMITKVSEFGSTSPQATVSIGSTILFWGKDGIYSLRYSELEGLQATDITAQTIQSLYEAIPFVSRQHCKVIHNANDKKVHWFYNDTAPVEGADRFKFSKVLTLDLQLEAFTSYTIYNIDTNSPSLVGALEVSPLAAGSRVDNIVVGADNIIAGADNVTVNTVFDDTLSINVKGTAIVYDGVDYRFTFTSFSDDTFKDWRAMDGVGVDAYAYAIPAYETFDEPSREKRATYVTTHFNVTETGFDVGMNLVNPSGCYMQAQWDWSNGGNLYSSTQQVYRFRRTYVPTDSNDGFDYGQSVLTSRTKVRGSGKALALQFSSEESKDFQLLGWTTNATVRA